jgi:hypothetical protein
MKRLLIAILAILMLSSCEKPPIDTSIYTADNPYVEENIRLTNDESLSSLVGMDRGGVYPDLQYFIKNFYDTVYIVRKKSSKSYYWEDGGKHIIYTDTVLEIKDKISGDSTNYNNTNIGDELRIVEYFSKSPNGEIWSSLTKARASTVVFALKSDRFEGIPGNGIDVLSSSISTSGIIYGTIDHKTEMAPLLKFDTDYLLVIEEKYFFEEGDKLLVDSIELESSQFVGKYIKYAAYELNETVYNVSRNELQTFKTENGEERYNVYIKNVGDFRYKKLVVDAWETYGNRVTE